MNLTKRGDIYLADFGESDNGKIGGLRPVLVIQNNTINKFSPTVIVAPLTSDMQNKKMPTHVFISKDDGLSRDSLILVEQIKIIHKSEIKKKLVQANSNIMLKVENALNLATSNSKIMNDNQSEYKQAYLSEYDLREIKEILKSSNYIGNRIKDWIYSGIISGIIGMIISALIFKH